MKSHAHSKPIVWEVNQDESVFGLTKINAILECTQCNYRRNPQIFSYSDFNIKGEVRRTYFLKEGL